MENEYHVITHGNVQTYSSVITQSGTITTIISTNDEHKCLLHLDTNDTPITLNLLPPLTTTALKSLIPSNTKCITTILITARIGRKSQINSLKFRPKGIRRNYTTTLHNITFLFNINNQIITTTPLQIAQNLQKTKPIAIPYN